MAGRQTGFYTMFSMIVMSLTLKVKMEMMRVNMFEPGSDSDDSDNLERAIEQEDNSLDQ